MTGELLDTTPLAARRPITQRAAAAHCVALGKLAALLAERGMRTRQVEWLKLSLHSGGIDQDSEWGLDRYQPELLVFGWQGRRLATVHIASQPFAYVLEVAQTGKSNEILPDRRYVIGDENPAPTAAMIPGYFADAS
ncbi:hypothetical protein ABZ907_35835 [Nonomuraea wenchangensis]